MTCPDWSFDRHCAWLRVSPLTVSFESPGILSEMKFRQKTCFAGVKSTKGSGLARLGLLPVSADSLPLVSFLFTTNLAIVNPLLRVVRQHLLCLQLACLG